MKISKIIITILATITTTVSANAKCYQQTKYINQRGSTLKLCYHQSHKEEHSGELSGTFITNVGNCETDMNKEMPISGFYNYNAIAITVNFPHCKQVVAMTGTIIDNQLHTIWLDASKSDDPTIKNWNSNTVGADYYNQIK